MTERGALSLKVALDKAERYCARSEHSERDVRRKCYEWQVPSEYVEELITSLRARSFIDDERFARAFARDKHRFSSWGRIRIEQELKQHRISTEIIRSVLSELFEELDEYEGLLKVLQAKRRQLKAQDSPRKHYEQMMRYGLYRGYDYDSVKRITLQLLQNEDLE